VIKRRSITLRFMTVVRDIALILHFIGMAILLGALLAARGRVLAGALHGAWLALIAGLVLVGVRYPLNEENPDRWSAIDNGKISVKLLILVIILVLGYLNRKKASVSMAIWGTMVALTITNIVVAVIW
jgi:uncharacterized integral membrane protein